MKRRVLCLLLALATACSLCIGAFATGDSDESDAQKEARAKAEAKIAALQQDRAEHQKKLEELKAKVAEAKKNTQDAMNTKVLLDKQNDELVAQIENAQDQIETCKNLIEENETRETEQYELFCRQVRSEEERGAVSYWSVLFKANSFADLLGRIDFINEVADYNKTVIADLRSTREMISQAQATLEEQEAELSAKQDELQDQVDAAAQLVKEYTATQKGYEAAEAAEAAAAEAIGKEIKKLQESTDVVYATGGYIWPVTTSKYITSPFGPRKSPGGIGSTNHKGVDIGGVRYDSTIYATKAGKVVIATYENSYGYYVMVDHGVDSSGNKWATCYAHMSAGTFKVKVGDYVTQGQALGTTGSTGHSTGPHLHYEIWKNGERIDPLPYLPGYIRYW